MSRCCFYMPMLLLILNAFSVQSAPLHIHLMDIGQIDRIAVPSHALSLEYALADKREHQTEIQLLKQQVEYDTSLLQMDLVQLNLMKILVILNVVTLICILYIIEKDIYTFKMNVSLRDKIYTV